MDLALEGLEIPGAHRCHASEVLELARHLTPPTFEGFHPIDERREVAAEGSGFRQSPELHVDLGQLAASASVGAASGGCWSEARASRIPWAITAGLRSWSSKV